VSVILFDGVCNVCDRFVQFVIARDPAERFQFGALQSEGGRRLLAAAPPFSGESMVLVEDGRLFTRSTAALRVVRRLRFPWSLLYGAIIVPGPLRDLVYDWFARNRYRWFGRREHCVVPTPEVRRRFVD
jgi:predicted DCC family thiol-disulfide oxidoreductase YuxK